MIKDLLKNSVLGLLSILSFSMLSAQEWDTISTPITTNFILQDISFPDGQSLIGYTGGTNFTFNGAGKLLKTTDGGDTWTVQWESSTSGTGITSLHFFTTLNGLAGTMSGDIMKTTDGGLTWTTWDIDPSTDQGELTDLDFYDDENGAIVSQWGGIYYSIDGGDSWTVSSTNYTGALDLYFADESTVYAVGYDQEIYKSTDGGDTWVFNYQGANGSGGNQYINLGVYFKDINNGVVTSEEGDYFTTSDGGATWEAGSIPTQFGLMRSAYMFDADNIYICATPGEVFYTADAGSSWTSQYYDYQPSFYKITFTSNGTGFVVGSASNGGTILKMEPNGLSVAEIEMVDLTLYPNPSSDFINIDISSLDANNVSLKLIDNAGKTVYSQDLSAMEGQQKIQIDVHDLSEGMYILNLSKKDNIISSEKIQIIK
jgi:photosystem II stability/assembly factor-like uncharacterized protein